MSVKLIADSGATKCEWCLLEDGKKRTIHTQGISPYFLNEPQIQALLEKALLPKLKGAIVTELHFYGTGLSNPLNVTILRNVLKKCFKKAKIKVETDLTAAARALCGKNKGIACILGTGSNSCYFDGKKMSKNSPGIGYILGDEGSGAYLGKKVIQHFLYGTFDEELQARFEKRFLTNAIEILENVYKKPLANRYLASFAIFLAENRGHYMIENIIEDGLNDFFFTHIYKYRESWTLPINFIGSVAFGFKDVLQELCNTYELELGKVMKAPMKGLIEFHS
ncbi:MAG TPA: N-acetylglucosamine kinase [Sediminibacterium sp.]|jgi:glucosamine kinase|nr:MAG: N-acetylglucosamine kinase [Sphingobacteriia bacterium 35-40-8]OZA63093.1 MAG: N-acetylglucosamine kinase [Sphingobacteriia bacterium 39-39-8]HQR94219.1 N-acetylglucosamine kinase [Sediminibacterium sp.]HQS56688.1 N-acetylglucosamine kinase [Sediminibacterium sp.]